MTVLIRFTKSLFKQNRYICKNCSYFTLLIINMVKPQFKLTILIFFIKRLEHILIISLYAHFSSTQTSKQDVVA